jgi:hypothetical protein
VITALAPATASIRALGGGETKHGRGGDQSKLELHGSLFEMYEGRTKGVMSVFVVVFFFFNTTQENDGV